MWSGRRRTNGKQQPGLNNFWSEFWRSMARESKMKENEKLRLENASNLGGIYFIDHEEKEFKEITKIARKKLEVPAAPAMPCKRTNSMHRATRSRHDDHKSTLVCILEADESKRLRLEGAPRYHEDHVAGKGIIHCIITTWYTNLFLCLRQWKKYRQQKQNSSGQTMGKNLRKVRRGIWRKSETNLTWSIKQEARVSKCISHHWWICAIWRMLDWRRRVVLRGEIVTFSQWWQNEDHLHHKWLPQKVMHIMSTLPECAKQATGSESAHTS